jgi:hypothetical protein
MYCPPWISKSPNGSAPLLFPVDSTQFLHLDGFFFGGIVLGDFFSQDFRHLLFPDLAPSYFFSAGESSFPGVESFFVSFPQFEVDMYPVADSEIDGSAFERVVFATHDVFLPSSGKLQNIGAYLHPIGSNVFLPG